ncbi:MAG: bifunctional transaldolase/phosoglucose isomerase [Thermodesulfobacteriota bacterium]
MGKLFKLYEQGQSIWFDFIKRSLLTSGELAALVEKGVTGVTSNPSIFEKAINETADYDAEFAELVREQKSVPEIYEALAVKDIALAADVLVPVYEKTEARDGFVSLEVDPELAHDEEKTVSEAIRLFTEVNRRNVMIKVPATQAGVAAVPRLIGAGVNVNVTLLFGLENYRACALAYLEGLELLAKSGPTVKNGAAVDKVASVASFFVSRVDTAVDKILAEKGRIDLQGKAAVANAKAAYEIFSEIFSGPRWETLALKGARVQRLLWASTGTKNPAYSDCLYVDTLIGPHTVNTVPPATLSAFLDHGVVACTITQDPEAARKVLSELASLGIDLAAITDKLQEEGVAAFAKSFSTLLAGVAEKKKALQKSLEPGTVESLGSYAEAVSEAASAMEKQGVVGRIFSGDHTVWKESPVEIANRLGWLRSPENMEAHVGGMRDFAREARRAGLTRALLMGMGGSSLAPEVFRFTFGAGEDFLDLSVIDSTDPGAVLEAARWAEPGKTLFIVSTKSGGTVETLSLFKYFYNRAVSALGREEAGKRFVAITDPGSELEGWAKTYGFRGLFLNDPDIGGRFSALSYFGLLPAAVVGVDVAAVRESALALKALSLPEALPSRGENPAVRLGAAMGALALRGRDKLTLIMGPSVKALGAWVEQLVAESTGKEGKGILPVCGEALMAPSDYGPDRFFVYVHLAGEDALEEKVRALEHSGLPVVRIRLSRLTDMGGEFLRWELATAVAGHLLRVNPFDQPDVESAKKKARALVAEYKQSGKLPEEAPLFSRDGLTFFGDGEGKKPEGFLRGFLASASQGDASGAGRAYVAIQAFLKPGPNVDAALANLRAAIAEKYKLAVTVGYGPRFLHSTGQLHKGDAGHGLFLQLTEAMPEDAGIPDDFLSAESGISFGVLKTAQALGDAQALRAAGRKVVRVDLGASRSAGIQTLAALAV